MKSIDAKILVDSGILFEINRKVLHPLGMALALHYDIDENNGIEIFNGKIDLLHTEDEEGVIFDPEVLERGKNKFMEYMFKEGNERIKNRRSALDFIIQDSDFDLLDR